MEGHAVDEPEAHVDVVSGSIIPQQILQWKICKNQRQHYISGSIQKSIATSLSDPRFTCSITSHI